MTSPNKTFFYLQLYGMNSGKILFLNAKQAKSTNRDKKYLTKRNVYCPILEPDCQMDHSKICYQKKTWHKMYSQILTENDQPETLVQTVDQVLFLFIKNNDRQRFPPFFKTGGIQTFQFFLYINCKFCSFIFFSQGCAIFLLIMVNLMFHLVFKRNN